MSVANSLKTLVAPVALAVAFSGAVTDAHALDFGCRDKDQVSQELASENQAPVVKFFIDGRKRGAKDPKWVEMYYTTNLNTGNGYNLIRGDGNEMCVMATTTNTKLFNNQTLDQKAFLDAPDATKKGSGINNIVYGSSQIDGLNPMLRVVENDPYLKMTTIKYLLGNHQSGKGDLVASTLDGKYIEKYSKGVPSAAEAPHGAQYTEVGKLLLGIKDDSSDKVARNDISPAP